MADLHIYYEDELALHPTPDELPQDKATCRFCHKRNPDQFFMEGFWAHDTCMDAQYDGDKEGTE